MGQPPGGPPDIHKAMRQRQVADARKREQVRKTDRSKREDVEMADSLDRPDGNGRLIQAREQGVHRYFLAGKQIKGGMEVELYVNARTGWIRGVFRWGGLPRSPVTIRVAILDPDASLAAGKPVSIGQIEIALPKRAICRWPQD